MRRSVAALGVVLAVCFGPASGQTVNVGQNFLGMTNTAGSALSGFSPTPPDTIGSVGPNHYAQFVNNAFAVYRKDGTLVSQMGNLGFWRAVSGSGFSTLNNTGGDPRVLFDPLSQRWFALELAEGGNNNRIL